MNGRLLGLVALCAAAVSHGPAAETVVTHAGTAYVKLGFDALAAFPFTPPDGGGGADPRKVTPAVLAQIPAGIKSRHGQKVAITGYLVPVKSEQGRVVEALLMRTTWAALNVAPFLMNEWVLVKIQAGAPLQTKEPVTFFGTLKVGPIFERGYLTGIYELEADRVSEGPLW